MVMSKTSFCQYEGCKTTLPRTLERTRRRFCSDACRKAHHRDANLVKPVEGGYVYAIGEGSLDSPIKVGWSNDPLKRLRNLQQHHPYELKLLGFVPGTRSYEQSLHERFNRLHLRGEWFKADDELLSFIKAWETL